MQVHVPILSKLDFGFARSPGPGLGNLLFPIARAIIAQQKFGGALLFPTIRQLKVGTYLRQEEDKRTYGDIFRPRSLNEWLAWTNFQISRFTPNSSTKYNLYRGMGKQFYEIDDYGPTLKKVFENYLLNPVHYEPVDIAIHLRLGDFMNTTNENTNQNFRNSKNFYLQALKIAKNEVKVKNPNIIIFTDSKRSEALDYLGLTEVKFEKKVNAMHSILKMSQAKIIITSRSTFSMWGQHFGDTKAIWPKEFNLNNFKPISAQKDIII